MITLLKKKNNNNCESNHTNSYQLVSILCKFIHPYVFVCAADDLFKVDLHAHNFP